MKHLKIIRFLIPHFKFITLISIFFIFSGCKDIKKASGKLDILNLKNWQIIVPEDSIPAEKYAAREFQHWYKSATGINLPVTAKVDIPKKNYVFIGDVKGLDSADGVIDNLSFVAAAPPIKEWLIQLRNSAVERGIIKDKNCFASTDDYGITPELGKAGIEAFEKAMELTGSEEIQGRVEKASIAAYRAAVGNMPVLLSGHMHSKWKKGLWKPEERLSPEAAEAALPYMRKLVELCRKYEVPRWSEAWTMEEALEIWNEVFGMEI